MKVKAKLNLAGLKELGMQHGEKAGFGLGVLVLVMFLWSAAQTTVLGPEKQPELLKESAEKTDRHILNSKWDPVAKGIEVVDYVTRAKRDPLNDKDYRHLVYLDKPLWEAKGKRPDPKLLPVEELMASAGSGIFSMAREEDLANPAEGPRGPGGGMGRMPGRPGMAGGPPMPGAPVAGKKKGKGDAAIDPPAPASNKRKRKFEVAEPEGVRVGGKANLKGFGWVVVTGLVPVRKQEAEFEEAFRNVILADEEADIPEYLGLKIERAEVNGDPNALAWTEIKLKDLQDFRTHWQTEAKEVVDELYLDPMYTMPLAPLVGVDWKPAIAGHPKVPVAVKNKNLQNKPKEDVNPDDEENPGGLGAVRKRVNDFGAPPPKERRKHARTGPNARHVDSTLFRFIDNTVEPGKKYCYRVKLRLANPNIGKAEKYLKDPASSKLKFRYSAWSDPTPIVSVPPDVDVYVGSVVSKPSAKEPLMKVVVTRLDHDRGIKLRADNEFTRGSLINIHKTITLDVDSENPLVVADAVLNTDSVVVDIQGGKPFKGPKSPTSPAEMVILHPDGSLEVRDELSDEPTYRTILPPDEPAEVDDGGGLVPNNPYGDVKNAPKKSKLETLREEAKKKKKHKGG